MGQIVIVEEIYIYCKLVDKDILGDGIRFTL